MTLRSNKSLANAWLGNHVYHVIKILFTDHGPLAVPMAITVMLLYPNDDCQIMYHSYKQ